MLRVGKCGTCQAPQDSAGTFPAGSFGEFPISHAAVMRESRESCAALPKEEKRETERERRRERERTPKTRHAASRHSSAPSWLVRVFF